MGMQTDFTQNFLVDALFRGGALNAAGTVNSTATVKGVWTATTAYVVGDTVVPHASMTGAGGKFLRCTTAGTTGSTNTLAVAAVGTAMAADGTVVWTPVSGVPCPDRIYVALLKANKGARANSTVYTVTTDFIALTANDGKIHLYKCTTGGTSAASQSTLYPGLPNEAITDGSAVFTECTALLDSNSAAVVEPSAGGYARQPLAAALANWAGTNGTSAVSTGTLGTLSNLSAVTYPTVSADYQGAAEKIWGVAIYDQLTTGNLLNWFPLTTLQSVLNGQAPPSFAIAAIALQIGA